MSPATVASYAPYWWGRNEVALDPIMYSILFCMMEADWPNPSGGFLAVL